MKRVLVGAMVVLLLVGVSGAVRAEEHGAAHSEEGVEVEVGLKAWFNKWKQGASVGDGDKSKCARLFGPAMEVKFPDHIFVEASYLRSLNDYRFNGSGGQVKLDRQDMDLAVGYAITPMVSVLAGYKESVFNGKGILNAGGFAIDMSGLKETVSGPLVGVRGSYALNEKTSILGGLNYLLTRLKEQGAFGGISENSPGWITEMGAQYEFAKQMSAELGYKYETNKWKDSKTRDTFSGFTLAVKYAF
jgi:opacity protein-like surface antigen